MRAQANTGQTLGLRDMFCFLFVFVPNYWCFETTIWKYRQKDVNKIEQTPN